MPVNLVKGQNLSLTRAEPGLKEIWVGLSWDARSTVGTAFDLDASAFLLGESGLVSSESDFVFYGLPKDSNGQFRHSSGSVVHTGDEREGAKAGDDEVMLVYLEKIPSNVTKIVFSVTIYDSAQNFGMVNNAAIRIAQIRDSTPGKEQPGDEIARYDLTEDFSIENAMVFGELYRHNAEWKFRAVGQGYKGGLAELCRMYGIQVS